MRYDAILFHSLTWVTLVWISGCAPSKNPEATESSKDHQESEHADHHGTHDGHDHGAGTHGGLIVSLGRDSYHVEAIVTGSRELRLYTLGANESRVVDIEVQDLTAYVKARGGEHTTNITLKPHRQPGDAEGRASLFVGELPESLAGGSLEVTVPNITIEGERFRLGFTTESKANEPEHNASGHSNAAGGELYLTPGGLYTQADIEANGNQTAANKFVGFQAVHNHKPQVGDRICPITLTKANSKCSWIVGGKTYEFCCPPCVDEFVTLAKNHPEKIQEPDHYIQR